MEIISYKKQKNNLYEITLSDKSVITLYDDVILKYEFLLKKEIEPKLLLEIKKENENIESYKAALKFINVKLRTEKEIRTKLMHYSKLSIEYTIERLKKENYLNEELYIKSYINDEINLKIVGPNKILYDLKKMGFNNEFATTYLNDIDDNIWQQKINKYIIKKVNSNHNLSGTLLKHKITQDLINKGFKKENIFLMMDNFDFNDNNLIKEKEYNKLKQKLSKKYSGEELDYHIKIGLLKKGFK